ncbi:STAS domain-containing protein [Yoonia algicola]|uniref:STAS domain-containing protein n=1 Tax=Yoonia algicola TaxID=3137368 RepID=A0AAN0M5L2_9RHOB
MTDETASFELPKIMKVEDCETLHGFLAAAQSKNIALKCHAVERLSGLSAQMLVMAVTAWRNQALEVTFASPSDGFRQSVAILGLSDALLPAEGAV